MRYVWRRERPDSGGPGRRRGGVGADNVYVPHEMGDRFGTTVFAHGTEPPTAAGVCGGEPGMQNAFAIVRGGARLADPAHSIEAFGGTVTRTAPKEVTHLDPNDAFVNWCAGGGGIGDPIEREYDAVVADVDEGLVSIEGAVRDYAVVAGDRAATEELRQARRRQRLGGREPRAPLATPRPGRRVTSTLVQQRDRLACRRCGTDLCDGSENVKHHLLVRESTVGERWPFVDGAAGASRFVLRRFFCPGCAVQVDVEVNLTGAPFVHSVELAS
jgi:N-methylhydantoinase B